MAVVKSRFGDDGKVFDNCTFDPSRMIIDTSTMQTINGFEELQNNRVAGRIREVATDYRERYARQQHNAAAHPQ
jgi:hypothetical protein